MRAVNQLLHQMQTWVQRDSHVISVPQNARFNEAYLPVILFYWWTLAHFENLKRQSEWLREKRSTWPGTTCKQKPSKPLNLCKTGKTLQHTTEFLPTTTSFFFLQNYDWRIEISFPIRSKTENKISFGHVERKAIADSEMQEIWLAVLIVRSCIKSTCFSLKKFIASPKCKPRSSFARDFKFCLSIFSFTFTPTKPLVPNVQVRNMFRQNVAWTSCPPLEIGPWTGEVVLRSCTVQHFCAKTFFDAHCARGSPCAETCPILKWMDFKRCLARHKKAVLLKSFWPKYLHKKREQLNAVVAA